MDPKVEVTQGKNVADAAKEAGVSHIIFSSLLNVTEATNGRLVHVPHFDGKADIEKHIRSTGVPCIFMLPGYFMSNLTDMMQKGEDGSFTLAYPTSDEAKFPLFEAAQDTGKLNNCYGESTMLNSTKQANLSRRSSRTAANSMASRFWPLLLTTPLRRFCQLFPRPPERAPISLRSPLNSTSLSCPRLSQRRCWRTTSLSRSPIITTGPNWMRV